MRLLDLIAQSAASPSGVPPTWALPSPHHFAEAVHACPLRLVLADDLIGSPCGSTGRSHWEPTLTSLSRGQGRATSSLAPYLPMELIPRPLRPNSESTPSRR